MADSEVGMEGIGILSEIIQMLWQTLACVCHLAWQTFHLLTCHELSLIYYFGYLVKFYYDVNILRDV